jgi:hypothetical protein
VFLIDGLVQHGLVGLDGEQERQLGSLVLDYPIVSEQLEEVLEVFWV